MRVKDWPWWAWVVPPMFWLVFVVGARWLNAHPEWRWLAALIGAR